ncbi:hypothetical protein DSECCO2_537040 [anaerobic digester metagenome]
MAVDLRLDGYFCRDYGADHGQGVFDDICHYHFFHILLAFMGKSEYLADQTLGAQTGFQRFIKIILRFGVFLNFPSRKCHISGDDGNDVVKVVSDASSHGADGFHLLGLAKLYFQLLHVA